MLEYDRLATALIYGLIAVMTVKPADKISFVYNSMQTRPRGQYNGK